MSDFYFRPNERDMDTTPIDELGELRDCLTAFMALLLCLTLIHQFSLPHREIGSDRLDDLPSAPVGATQEGQ